MGRLRRDPFVGKSRSRFTKKQLLVNPDPDLPKHVLSVNQLMFWFGLVLLCIIPTARAVSE